MTPDGTKPNPADIGAPPAARSVNRRGMEVRGEGASPESIPRIFVIAAIAVWAWLLLDGSRGVAAVVYTYTGNNFGLINDNSPPSGTYTTAMSVTGSFVLDAALAGNLMNQQITPTSFSFFDGRSTLTSSGSLSDETFQVSTNAQGDITSWYVSLTSPLAVDPIRSILTSNSVIIGIIDQGSISSGGSSDSATIRSPGTWSVTAAVPEPSALMLLGTAASFLACCRCFRRRRRSPSSKTV